MSPAVSNLLEIKTWLKEKHVIVPLDWIEACIEFLKQEFNNTNFPLPRLKTLVYEQWLAADLREIGVPSLPPDLENVAKTSLNGYFALQVNGIKDVGKPAYAQLRELEGSTNTDVEVSAAPRAYVPEWEAKPTRMLILTLTDGTTSTEAMEYRPIVSLSPNLPPGIKVLIKGPIECRLGMLLLSSEKIEILGGQVDGFQTIYSREGILREALNLTSSSDRQSDQNSNQNAVSFLQQSQSDTPRGNGVNPLHMPMDPPTSYPASHDPLDDMDDDDFVRSIDYDALDEIEKASTQATNSGNNDEHIDEDVNLLYSAENFLSNGNPCFSDDDDIIVINECATSDMNSRNEEQKKPKVSCALLSDIDQNKKEEFTITIKGYIVNVLSRLECKLHTGWHLTAKVSDGSSTIDTDFHDKVLEGLVGLSAQDMMAMQSQCREKPELKSKIMEAIGGCKNKLQELNCFLEVKFTPGERPCVIRCFEN